MNALRQILRQKRRAINPGKRHKLAKQLLARVQKKMCFRQGQKIAIYLTNDGEIDGRYIIDFLKNKGFSVYLPILFGQKLQFSKISQRFKKNRFGIAEPVSTQILGAHQMNIIFMPLVGFDKNKNRLGMGGGFYDRTLAFKKRQKRYKHPQLVGLAFDCQKVDKLNAKSWDVVLNTIITPSSVYT